MGCVGVIYKIMVNGWTFILETWKFKKTFLSVANAVLPREISKCPVFDFHPYLNVAKTARHLRIWAAISKVWVVFYIVT